MIRLGRVSKITRGFIIPRFVEDLILCNPGSIFPCPVSGVHKRAHRRQH